MTAVVALALGAALAYGIADFFGGVAARRASVFSATTVNYVVAALVLVIVVVATGGTWSAAAVSGGLLGGLFAVIGFLAFYAALAVGPISLVTPLIALLSSAVPVVAALVIGETLRPLAWIAVALAIAGSVLIGIERHASLTGLTTRTVVLTVVSGLGFGFATIALDRVPADSAMIPVLLDSASGAVLLLALAAVSAASPGLRRVLALLDAPATEAPPRDAPQADAGPRSADPDPSLRADARASDPPEAGSGGWIRTPMALAAFAGLLIGFANVLLMLALHAGNVAVVAVLTNLYPLATMALAWAVLRERISALQAVGAALALAASVMLGLA